MIVGLLDPGLFLLRRDEEVQEEFDFVLRTCRDYSIALPALDEYWHDLWSALGRPLEQALGPAAKRALHEVRRISQRSALPPPLAASAGRVWRRGFHDLFGTPHFAQSWEERMARAAIRALAAGTEVVMLTRRMPGRNLVQHASGGSTLDENTRWILYLQPRGMGHQQVLCVHHPRNLTERWTSRFDWRLPGLQRGVRYPFCPPDAWWKWTTPVWRTLASKPAWLDRHGNGWARPNMPGGAGYHWDVYIESVTLREAVGLDQINVVAFGVPAKEGAAGQLHHEPKGKAGKISQQGWTC